MTDSEENKTCPSREPPEYHVDKEKLAEFAADADVLPLYEKSTMEYIFRKHYSLKNNMYLKCAWSKFKDNITSRVAAPIQLPGQSDIHFHNQAIKLVPSESIHKQSNFRKSLKPGPGVDYGGQMPIPQDLISKRPAPQKDKEHNKKTCKNKNIIRHLIKNI